MTRLSLLLSLLLLPSFGASQTNHTTVTFTAMGCGPYTPEDADAIRFYIQRENKLPNRSEFIIHLGDINSGKAAREGKTNEQTYIDIRDLLTASNTIPTYIEVGDNEWNDHKTPDKAWSWWNRHLLKLEDVHPPNWLTERQAVRRENFSFTHKAVLFIGINLVGGKVHDSEEWQKRFEQNNDWIEAQFEKHSPSIHAAVLFFQANPVGQGPIEGQVKNRYQPFCNRLSHICANSGKPILLLHADGHKWIVDHPWKTAPNITRIQLDRINAQFPPVQFTITRSASEPFKFDRRLGNGGWAFDQKD